MKRKTKMKYVWAFLLLCFAMSLLSGCVPGDGTNTPEHEAGFFWGIWHGWIAPVSLIIGLFKSHIRVYEMNNSGWWYDLGFYIAIISGFGSISVFRRKNSDRD
ncbi:hypothetical protein [Paenibacillus donghaensis]|uniref:hypothetical protein n=1 Tax=Paenibacillus donghaensis TaxID=414771 RepID=UPI001D15FEA1|nr:hypothetical protein [Paenibacillus donghaensis]